MITERTIVCTFPNCTNLRKVKTANWKQVVYCKEHAYDMKKMYNTSYKRKSKKKKNAQIHFDDN